MEIKHKIKEHFGNPVIVETEKIRVAKVPVNGEKLEESIILHPRYVPRSVKHEIIEVEGYRIGRTIDILLEKPIVVDGKEYAILNFKGVGAADNKRQMIIHPDDWFRTVWGRLCWIPREIGDPFGRVWGGLTNWRAELEQYSNVLSNNGIAHTPQIAINCISPEIYSCILKVENGEEIHSLSQLVRAQTTNIRMELTKNLDYCNLKTDLSLLDLVGSDSSIINAQLELAVRGKMIKNSGNLADNRFYDGVLTDLENYMMSPFSLGESTILIMETVRSSTNFFRGEDKKPYYKELEKRTGIAFSKMGLIFSSFISEEFTRYLSERKISFTSS